MQSKALELIEWSQWFLANVREKRDFRWQHMQECQDELRRQHAEIERLNAALKYEQDRSGRIGTHGHGCHLWGYRHHECLEREYGVAIKALRRLVGWFDDDSRDSADKHLKKARAAIAKAEGGPK